MIGIVYISVFVLILLVVIIHGIYAREKYEAETGFALIIFIYFIGQALYFVLFNLSTENYFKIEISQTLWEISIFIRIFSIGLLSSIHGVELHKHSKVRYLGIIIYFFLEGIISSLLLFPNSFFIPKPSKMLDFHSTIYLSELHPFHGPCIPNYLHVYTPLCLHFLLNPLESLAQNHNFHQ